MGEEFGIAIVDAHRGHVFDPIATVEIPRMVPFERQVEGKVPVSKHKHIHRLLVRGGQPIQTVLDKVLLRSLRERLFGFLSAPA